MIEICKNPSVVNPSIPSAVQEALRSYKWGTLSADKSPWGIISRFACIDCGDEFVAMLTSSRGSRTKKTSNDLEVSVKNAFLT
jgi:hypothetical protein